MEFQLPTAEGVMETENLHLAKNTLVIVSGENEQQMLKSEHGSVVSHRAAEASACSRPVRVVLVLQGRLVGVAVPCGHPWTEDGVCL